jgi:sec-independent protein translocase protein TatA
MFSLNLSVFVTATFFGGWEIVLILGIILILLGAKRLPQFMKGFGDGLHHFRKAIDEQSHEAGESLGGIYGKPAAEALTPDNQTAELYDPAAFRRYEPKRSMGERWRRLWDAVLRFLRIRR